MGGNWKRVPREKASGVESSVVWTPVSEISDGRVATAEEVVTVGTTVRLSGVKAVVSSVRQRETCPDTPHPTTPTLPDVVPVASIQGDLCGDGGGGEDGS